MRKSESRLVTMVATTTVFTFLSTLAPNLSFTPSSTTPYHTPKITVRSARRPIERIDEDDNPTGSSTIPHEADTALSRRLFASQTIGATALLLLPPSAPAGIDVNSLRSLPVERDPAATRLNQLQQQGTRLERVGGDPMELPVTRLSGGVIYRDVKSGREGRTVRRGSTVGTEMSVRCKSLATAEEPMGLVYFSTKEDTNYNELQWKIDAGDFVKGVEEGMLGMKLNAVRYIEVPSQQIFAARNAGLLPEAKTEEGKQRYDNAFKADATLIFEVTVTAINQGDNRI